MIARYGGLRRAMITVRDDGLLDVVRERETTGEAFRGLATLDEAFAVIRAHCAAEVRGDEQRPEAAEKEK